MAHSTFDSKFHSSFLNMAHAWEASLVLSLVSSLTLLRHILAKTFHSPVKTRCGLVLTGQCGFCTECDQEAKRREEKCRALLLCIFTNFLPKLSTRQQTSCCEP